MSQDGSKKREVKVPHIGCNVRFDNHIPDFGQVIVVKLLLLLLPQLAKKALWMTWRPLPVLFLVRCPLAYLSLLKSDDINITWNKCPSFGSWLCPFFILFSHTLPLFLTPSFFYWFMSQFSSSDNLFTRLQEENARIAPQVNNGNNKESYIIFAK